MSVEEAIKSAGTWVVWIASVIGGAGVIWKLIAKPLKSISAKMDGVQDGLKTIQNDTGDLMGDRLSQAHDYWMRKGFCPKSDKERLLAMHKRYAAMGRNHLAEHYEKDLIELPESIDEKKAS